LLISSAVRRIAIVFLESKYRERAIQMIEAASCEAHVLISEEDSLLVTLTMSENTNVGLEFSR